MPHGPRHRGQAPQHRVDRREATDAAAVAVRLDAGEEPVGVAARHRLQHRAILALDAPQLVRRHRLLVAEARPHVSEIGAGHERHAPAEGVGRLRHRVEEARHPRIVFRPPPVRERLVREARQDRDDREVAPPAEEVAKEHRLELDRVLRPMPDLRREAVVLRPTDEGVDEVLIGRGGAERCVVVLAREGKRHREARVAGAEDHEDIGVATFGEVAVRPGVGGTTAVEVDVGRDDRAHGRTARAPVDPPGPGRRGEEAVHRAPQLVGIAGV